MDAYFIKTLIEVVGGVVSCEDTIQVSFPHKCGQFSCYGALNVEVAITFPYISFFSLLTQLYYLPWNSSFQYGGLPKVFPRYLCTSGSSVHALVSLFSSVFLSMCTWILIIIRSLIILEQGP